MKKYKDLKGFTRFLIKHKNLDSPVGDLARDFIRDEDTKDVKSCCDLQTRIIIRQGNSITREALVRAFKDYIKEHKRRNT